MQNKFAEASPRTFNPMFAPELSDEARKAAKAAFDAMSTWRADIVKSSEKNGEQVYRQDGCGCPGDGMAGANRRCHPCANTEHRQNADPNDGSHHGCLGGADEITVLLVDDAVEAQVLAELQPGWQLAKRRCFPNSDDEPRAVLDTIGGAVAERLGRRDGVLG
jgi:hypothetical protein